MKKAYITFHIHNDATKIYHVTINIVEENLNITRIEDDIVKILNGTSKLCKQKYGVNFGKYEKEDITIANVIIL